MKMKNNKRTAFLYVNRYNEMFLTLYSEKYMKDMWMKFIPHAGIPFILSAVGVFFGQNIGAMIFIGLILFIVGIALTPFDESKYESSSKIHSLNPLFEPLKKFLTHDESFVKQSWESLSASEQDEFFNAFVNLDDKKNKLVKVDERLEKTSKDSWLYSELCDYKDSMNFDEEAEVVCFYLEKMNQNMKPEITQDELNFLSTIKSPDEVSEALYKHLSKEKA